ncbi:hypothetical protein KC19_9G054800 [Ceratodon purpureus]|uniref:Uncharacterized protein n=1 Tax=Ceratodon purpureus TaxID=3225 RepID=A0A8T0GRU8_CERPU|nr:hypothetical protein KC19_9G054800 [Ceratodon purpureus]
MIMRIICGWKLEHVPSHVPQHVPQPVPHRFDVIKITHGLKHQKSQLINERYLTLALFQPTSGTVAAEELSYAKIIRKDVQTSEELPSEVTKEFRVKKRSNF